MRFKNAEKQKAARRGRRHKRVRAKINGTAERPRLSVFRSNKHIAAQLIDDASGRTKTAADSRNLAQGMQKVSAAAAPSPELKAKCAIAFHVGVLLGMRASEQKITMVVFDKGAYRYQGRVKALAEGARAAGLQF